MISNGTGDGVGPTSSHYASISNPSQMICVELNHELGPDSDENYWRKQLNINPFSPPRQCDGLAFLNWHSIGESPESMSLRSSDAANCVDRHPIQQPAPRSYGDPQGIDGNHGAAMTSNLDHAPLVSSIPNITAPGHFSAAEPSYQPLNGKACPEKLSMVEPSARKDKPFTFHESYDEGSSKGKQPQHNGKGHEGAGSGRPGPGISHTVGKTCAKPVGRTHRKSAPRGGKKQRVHIDADETPRIREPDWTQIETLLILLKKLEFSKTPGGRWSERASEFLKSQGFHRTSKACQQRWDTMKKHYDKILDPSRIDEGNVPAGFLGPSLLYDLMQMIMGGHGEQQSPSKDTQSSEQLEGALAQSSAIHTDTIEFSNADGPSLPPDVPTFLSDDAYASGQKTNSSLSASLYASMGWLLQEEGRVSQEVGRVSHESGRVSHEAGRVSQEVGRVSQEAGRESQEVVRVSQEAGRESQEVVRVSQDVGRVSREVGRVSQEVGRVSQEVGRVSQEVGRVSQEVGRVSQEAGRVSQEAGRVSSEVVRVSQEVVRVSQEVVRVSQEVGRVSEEVFRVSKEVGRVSKEVGRVSEELKTMKDRDAEVGFYLDLPDDGILLVQ